MNRNVCTTKNKSSGYVKKVCTSGRKHETLSMGVFEYADSKNRGNHDVIPVFPSQKLKINNGRPRNAFKQCLVLTRLPVPRLP